MDKQYIIINLNKAESAETLQARVKERVRWGVFGILIAKEVFGGTGMNILNVALTARVFLYFGFPSDISGDVWTYYGDNKEEIISGYSGATPLSIAAFATAVGITLINLGSNVDGII